ncbi:hypothetical protein ACI65C_008680 [Semiaphis heraclei]
MSDTSDSFSTDDNDSSEETHDNSHEHKSDNVSAGTTNENGITSEDVPMEKVANDCNDDDTKEEMSDDWDNSKYENYKKLAIEKCEIEDFVSTEKRKKNRKTFIDDGPATDDSNAIDFKVTTYLAILDRIQAELIKRKIAYDELNKKYQFVLRK